MTDFYQNDKNSQNNSSGIHSDVELDSNHNQVNGKAVIDLMVKRDETTSAGQFTVSFAILPSEKLFCGRNHESLIFKLVTDDRATEFESAR